MLYETGKCLTEYTIEHRVLVPWVTCQDQDHIKNFHFITLTFRMLLKMYVDQHTKRQGYKMKVFNMFISAVCVTMAEPVR